MRTLFLASLLSRPFLAPSAQARPSAAEAQALLQARPELVQQLRQRITSGMTAEEVRDEQKGQNQEESDEPSEHAPFRSATSLFLPTMDGPVDANYRLGPGDQLALILTGQVEDAHTLDVTRECSVVIPQVGQIAVTNLTMEQLENLLNQCLPRSYSGVRGAGRTVATLDVYDYLLRGDNSADVRLENGDVLFVRTHGPRVRVAGEVVRPATYELKPGETLRDALTAAGGGPRDGSDASGADPADCAACGARGGWAGSECD